MSNTIYIRGVDKFVRVGVGVGWNVVINKCVYATILPSKHNEQQY